LHGARLALRNLSFILLARWAQIQFLFSQPACNDQNQSAPSAQIASPRLVVLCRIDFTRAINSGGARNMNKLRILRPGKTKTEPCLCPLGAPDPFSFLGHEVGIAAKIRHREESWAGPRRKLNRSKRCRAKIPHMLSRETPWRTITVGVRPWANRPVESGMGVFLPNPGPTPRWRLEGCALFYQANAGFAQKLPIKSCIPDGPGLVGGSPARSWRTFGLTQ